MSHPPPPGTGNLPARPPPPSSSGGFNRGGFKPAAFSQPQPSYGAAPTTYGPSPPPAQAYPYNAPPSRPQYAAPPGPASSPAVSAAPSYPPSYQRPQQSHGPQSYGPQSYGPQSYGPQSHGPQIKNPFPAAAGTGSDFDPEMAAQIAQWQSAYVSRPDEQDPQHGPQQGPQQQPAAAAAAAAAANAADAGKTKTAVREGGGKKWTDDTLLEWDPSHLRLFVGNLAGETTDDSLLKAFSRWSSVQKARVIRDKRTSKSKGYGFVSFSNADDFFSAAKEMNGKYIQSHPVVVRKANTEIKVATVKDKDRKRHGGGRDKRSGSGHGGHGGHGGGGGGYDPQLGPYGGAGVTKPGQKTRNGLKLLG